MSMMLSCSNRGKCAELFDIFVKLPYFVCKVRTFSNGPGNHRTGTESGVLDFWKALVFITKFDESLHSMQIYER